MPNWKPMLALTALWLMPLAARAQSLDTMMEVNAATTRTYTNTHIDKLATDRIVRGGSSSSRNGRGSSRGKPAPAVARTVTTTFTPFPAVRKGITDNILAMARKSSPKNVPALTRVFQKYDFVDVYRENVQQYGLQANDVADALAAQWLLAYTIFHPAADVTPTQARAVRNQAQAILATSREFAGYDNTRRQQMGQTTQLQYVFWYGGASGARQSGNKSELARIGDQIATQARRNMGLNLRELTLTEAGFRAR